MANFIVPVTMTSIDSAALTGGYDVLSAGLENECFMIKIINNSNTGVTISFDGLAPHDFVPANSVTQINGQANAPIPHGKAVFKNGQKVYVKGAAGIGLIYVAGYANGR